MGKKVTITDLARAAEVSVTTVSQILNGKESRFSKKTIKKVKELQIKMGYVPDFNAQSLIKKSGKTIGIIVPNINNPFFSRFLKGVEEEAIKQSYIPLIFGSNDNEELESHYLIEALKRSSDGVIIASPMQAIEDINNLLTQNEVPYLLIDQAPIENGDQIDANNYEGGRLVADYLIKAGHKKLTVLNEVKKSLNLINRLNGFLDLAKEHEDVEVTVVESNLTKVGGYEATQAVIDSKPTAVFAINDELAIGLNRGLREKGVSVPDDISLVGYDNIDLTEYVTPKLTTVNQPALDMGRIATELVIKRIQDPKLKISNTVLPVELVERESVKQISK